MLTSPSKAGLLLTLCLIPLIAGAQTLSGRITDTNTGELLPYASIFVQETGKGATSNAEGRYELRLPGGRSTLVVQYLGYQTQVIEVTGGRSSLDIELVPEALDLEEVTIISGAEDKSYSVIRRAIAKADYHNQQVDRYTALVYVKGSGEIEKIPGIVMKFLDEEDREDTEEVIGRKFTSESRSKITYQRPKEFKEEVISRYQRGDAVISLEGFMFSNFYQPEIAEAISPLSSRAFAYYRYAHEGAFADRGELVHKIQVIPRSRGENVFEGYLYIVDGDWSIHSLDLRTYRTGFTVDIAQNYNEIEPHVWMPTTTRLDARGGLMGVKFSFNYVNVTSDYDIALNPDLGGYVEIIDEVTQPEEAAAARAAAPATEEALQDGGELTRKQLRKMLREYAREDRKEREEPEVIGSYTFNDDSVQTIRDSAAWEALRPIPLTEEEKEGYQFQDTLAARAKEDSIAEAQNPTEEVDLDATPRVQLFKSAGLTFEPEGAFNPVEGYALGGTLRKSLRLPPRDTGASKRRRRLGTLSLRARYGFAWNRLVWEAGYERKGFYLRGGRFVRQFNDAPAIDPNINSIWALWGGQNFVRLYERAYLTTGYAHEFSDAFELEGSLSYEDRRALTNNSDHRWGGDEEFAYQPNAPFNEEIGRRPTDLRPAALLELSTTWRPGLRYFVRNGQRQIVENSAPTLSLGFVQGLPVGDAVSEFTHLRAGLRHQFRAGRKGDIKFLVQGGAFVAKDYVGFPDYRHFNTSEIFLTRLDPIGSYRLLPYYSNSTAEEYLETYLHYQFRKFLLTQIFELHIMGLKEDLFVNYLYTPTSDHYTELGYSLDNILRIFRLEFVTSFRDGRYEDFGVRLSLTTGLAGLL